MAISKKRCPLASKRNRIKRIVRESFRHNQNKLIGLDVIVINKVKTKTATNNKLASSLEQHWHKIMINKETISKIVVPTMIIGWLFGLFFMGWQTILWSALALLIGLIAKTVSENTRV